MLTRKKLLIIITITTFYAFFHCLHQSHSFLKDTIIILDPGHGGKDKGATGIQGTLEKDINLHTSKMLQRKLESYGATVFLTREDDSFISLSKRVSFATKKDADLFISIHYNSSPSPNPEGITSFYSKDSSLATIIHEHILDSIKSKDRHVLFGDYYVLRENTIPSTLLELGFISNKAEEQYILTKQYQQEITSAITRAILEYITTYSP